MSNVAIEQHNGILVVDSRLIAEQLKIQHKNFLSTIDKYLPTIESAFGTVAFETREFKTRQGNRSTERFAWLTEEQSTFLMTLSRNTKQVVNCKVALVQAFAKAKKIIEQVILNQVQEIEKLKLELELAKTQERLMMTTQAIATMHGHEMVALVLGKPDAVITKVEHIETLVTVDRKGKAIALYDGLGITFLAKRYGFGKNTKACRAWLESIGINESQWLTEPSLIKSKKLPRELLSYLDQQYGTKQGVRQRLIGE